MATGSLSAWRVQPEASKDEVASWFNEDGRLVKVAEMRKAVFRVGVVPSCRRKLWKYLYGIYEPSFSHREQSLVDLQNAVQYSGLKQRWRVLDDMVALTKDDLNNPPPYMVDSDDEAMGGDNSPTPTPPLLLGADDKPGNKGSASNGPLDGSSFCLLQPTTPLLTVSNGHYSGIDGTAAVRSTTEVTPVDGTRLHTSWEYLGHDGVYSAGNHGGDCHDNSRRGDADVASSGCDSPASKGSVPERKQSAGSGASGADGDGVGGMRCGGGRKERSFDDGDEGDGSCARCRDMVGGGEGGGVEDRGEALTDLLRVAARVFAARHTVDTMESYSQCRRTILRDVARTDRHNHYFSHKRNLRKVHRILLIFALFHPEVGYCQGMNDILAVFLLVSHSEVDAYWMFCAYMKDKQLDEDTTLEKIEMVKKLLAEEDRDMMSFLEHSECCEMLFCHKWLLVDFKREFESQDAIHMYEVIRCHNLEMSGLGTGGCHFQLCVCVAILVLHKGGICTNGDAVSIYSTINQLATRMNLVDILSKAEIIFNKHGKKVFGLN